MMRTDSHRNPVAFTVDVAKEAGLKEGVDFAQGDSFSVPTGNPKHPVMIEYTARLIGDPVALTIRVIDKIGFYTHPGGQRWNYIGIPPGLWVTLPLEIKRAVIGGMYHREGGTEMKPLFPTMFMF